ncbi:hypothetical protein WJX82_010005 [Trebouxia sp. C0006]
MAVDHRLRGLAYVGDATELDITADTMSLLLNWLYAGVKASLTLSQAVSLFKLSHHFDTGKLQHQCEQTLNASVGLEALPQLEDLTDSFHCVQLKKTCQHFRALLDEDGLKQLDEGLAWYAAAQAVQDPICRAYMPPQADPSSGARRSSALSRQRAPCRCSNPHRYWRVPDHQLATRSHPRVQFKSKVLSQSIVLPRPTALPHLVV